MGTINQARRRLLLPPVEGGEAEHAGDSTAIVIGCGFLMGSLGLAILILAAAAFLAI